MARKGYNGRKATKHRRRPRMAQHTPRGVVAVKYPERLRLQRERVESLEANAIALATDAQNALNAARDARTKYESRVAELTPQGPAPKRRADLYPITKLRQAPDVSRAAQRRIEADALADVESALP